LPIRFPRFIAETDGKREMSLLGRVSNHAVAATPPNEYNPLKEGSTHG